MSSGINKNTFDKVQTILPLDKIIKSNRLPVFFIGSGISRRYMNMPTWDELLGLLSDLIGLSRLQFNAMKNKISSENDKKYYHPALASFLEDTLIDRIQNGKLDRTSFLDMDDEEWKMMEEGNQFRTLICHILRKCTLTEKPELLSELNSMRKLADKIPSVITTNYDSFLESQVFTNFTTLNFPSDYYLSDSGGYGDILKIHGTMEKPETMIVTERDYEKLNNNSQLVMARVLSLMCHHPILFLGYSISDPEIENMIDNIVQSLDAYDLKKFKGNMIHITADGGCKKPIWKPKKHTGQNNKTFEITELIVPNLQIVFDYIDKIQPVASPQEIRRYKSMISNIVLTSNPNSRRIRIINGDNTDRIPDNEWAVIFGSIDSIESMITGVVGYKPSLVVEDVMRNRKGLLDSSRTHFITWISEKNNRKGFVPVFHYVKKFNLDIKDLPNDVQGYVDAISLKIKTKMEEIELDCSNVRSKEEIEPFLKSCNKSFHSYTALAYFKKVGLLNREECRKMIEDLYQTRMDTFPEESKMPTDLRVAITCLDYCDE